MLAYEFQPIPLDDEYMLHEFETMLRKAIDEKFEVAVEGWVKDLEARKKKAVPHESLETQKGKHLCYHEGKWVDREHSGPKSDSEFGIAYVTISENEEGKDQVDRAIKELDGKCFADCVIHISTNTKNRGDYAFQG